MGKLDDARAETMEFANQASRYGLMLEEIEEKVRKVNKAWAKYKRDCEKAFPDDPPELFALLDDLAVDGPVKQMYEPRK